MRAVAGEPALAGAHTQCSSRRELHVRVSVAGVALLAHERGVRMGLRDTLPTQSLLPQARLLTVSVLIMYSAHCTGVMVHVSCISPDALLPLSPTRQPCCLL